MPRFALGILASTVLLLAGCGTVPGDPDRPEDDVAVVVDTYDCLAPNLYLSELGPPLADAARPPAPDPGRVPAGFDPVAAYRCDSFGAVEDAEGRWSAVIVERLEGDLAPLLAALAEPHDAPYPMMPCTADMELVAPLWLVDASGRAMRASYPTTGCGKTKPAVHEALDALGLTQSFPLKQQLLEPRAAIDAGCAAEASPPMTGLLGLGGALLDGDGTVIPLAPPAQPSADEVDGVRWCQYGMAPAAPDEEVEIPGFDGQGYAIRLRTARFVSGGELGQDVAWLALAAASGAVIPTECDDEATQFIVLTLLDDGMATGHPIIVELDGCVHLVAPDGQPRLAPDELREVLPGV